MIWGAEEIEKKNFGGPSPGKDLERLLRGKNKLIFEFSSGPPQSLMVHPLVQVKCYCFQSDSAIVDTFLLCVYCNPDCGF